MTRRLSELTFEQAERQSARARETNRAWREAHPDYHREWAQAHRTELNERQKERRRTEPKRQLTKPTDPGVLQARRASNREWRRRNKARIADYMRAYRAVYLLEHRDEIAAKKRADYAADPQRVIERSRRWALEQPTRRRAIAAASAANRRAEASGVHGRISAEDVIEVWRRQPDCLGCGDGRGLDHVVPLFAGGPNTTGNLQNLCPPCNSRKGARVPA